MKQKARSKRIMILKTNFSCRKKLIEACSFLRPDVFVLPNNNWPDVSD
jgi:hypothetical protein